MEADAGRGKHAECGHLAGGGAIEVRNHHVVAPGIRDDQRGQGQVGPVGARDAGAVGEIRAVHPPLVTERRRAQRGNAERDVGASAANEAALRLGNDAGLVVYDQDDLPTGHGHPGIGSVDGIGDFCEVIARVGGLNVRQGTGGVGGTGNGVKGRRVANRGHLPGVAGDDFAGGRAHQGVEDCVAPHQHHLVGRLHRDGHIRLRRWRGEPES